MLIGSSFLGRCIVGLGSAGQALHDSIAGLYTLDPDESEILELAARTADDLVILEAALVGADPMNMGSTGQQRVNPLIAEVRATRALIGQLLARTDLPDPAAAAEKAQSRSGQATKAAAARWGRGSTA